MSPLLIMLILPAQTYRLSGDALVLARAPAGVIALGGDARPTDWVSADALIWAGLGPQDELDALVAALHLRHPNGWAELHAGRLIASGGAIRAIQLDGGRTVLRAPFGTSLEAFGGVPVGHEFTGRGGDWLAAGRISQRIGRWSVVGASIFAQGDAGDLADREIGLDLGLFPLDAFDLSVRASYDLIEAGLSELVASSVLRLGVLRADLFLTTRSPSRILPATSVFSVLGDVPATRAGARLSVAAAPRLDIYGQGGVRSVDGLGEELILGATLRLDDLGRGVLTLQGRRDGTPGAGWSGVRLIARIPFLVRFVASTELELVVPDHSTRGNVWPWGLIAFSWRPHLQWEISAALEASASPQHEVAIDGLFRATYRWAQ